MTLVAAWAAVAAALGVLMRRAGPWPRVAIGCAAWPAWPAIIGVSYARYRARRARQNKEDR